MAFPSVGQAAMLAAELGRAIAEQKPRSVALLGCAGGNGLDQLKSPELSRVVCLDINADYVRQLKTRYTESIPSLECHVGEVESFRPDFCVDLIFEYTRLEEAIGSIAHLLREGGDVVAVLQLPAQTHATITPSPYAEALSAISGFFQYIDPRELTDLAAQGGLTLQEERTLTLDSGKSFMLLRMKKTSLPEN